MAIIVIVVTPHLHAFMAAPVVRAHMNVWLAKLVNRVGAS